jgi:hypothetical protein
MVSILIPFFKVSNTEFWKANSGEFALESNNKALVSGLYNSLLAWYCSGVIHSNPSSDYTAICPIELIATSCILPLSFKLWYTLSYSLLLNSILFNKGNALA